MLENSVKFPITPNFKKKKFLKFENLDKKEERQKNRHAIEISRATNPSPYFIKKSVKNGDWGGITS